MSGWLLAALGIVVAGAVWICWRRVCEARGRKSEDARPGPPQFELPAQRRRGASGETQRSRYLHASEQRFCAVMRDLRTTLVLAQADTDSALREQPAVVLVGGDASTADIGCVAANLALALGALGSVLLAEPAADDALVSPDGLPRRWPAGMIDVVACEQGAGGDGSVWLAQLRQRHLRYEWIVIDGARHGLERPTGEPCVHSRAVFRILVQAEAPGGANNAYAASKAADVLAVVRLSD